MSSRPESVLSDNSTAISAGTNGALAAFGLLTLHEWAAIIGIACGLGTFVLNGIFKLRADRRAERLANHHVKISTPGSQFDG